MLKIKNINWEPVFIRKSELAFCNCWLDDKGNHLPFHSIGDKPDFSSFKMLKFYENSYFNKLEDYKNNRYVERDGFLKKEGVSIDLRFFTQKELSTVIGYWDDLEYIDSLYFKFVGSRPLELSESSQKVFFEICKIGHQHIEKILIEHEKQSNQIYG